MARKPSPITPSDPDPNEFTAKLNRLLEAKRAGRTDTEIAREAGMKKQALFQLTSGDNANPKLNTLMRILKALDASLSDFDQA